MKKRYTLFLIFNFSFLISHAGGFQVNLQGQKQMGMGHTGTGLLLDGASLFFNPGSTAFLDSVRLVQIGASFIIPRTEYLEAYPGIYTAEMVHHTGTPFSIYAAGKIKNSSKLTLGLAVYTPFGSHEEWPKDWKGQFLLREIDLKAIFIQPTASYKINDKLGIGFGVAYVEGDFSLQQGIPVQDSTGTYGTATLHGSANSWGFNGGIYFKPTAKFSVGLDYRSSVKIKMKNGDANFTVASALADSFPPTTFNTTLTLPSTTTIGFGYIVNEKLKTALDINYIAWHVYDTLAFDFTNNTTLLKDVHSPRMYKNTFIIRGGVQYKMNGNIFLRGGIYFDKTPVQSGYLTPETPDANRLGVTAGLSWKANAHFNFDVSFLYIEGMKRTDTNIETQFSGTYKARAVAPGFAIEYLF
ncbi:MAG: outer membrane protein transport protein [Bacteroidetes bacterium]|nr:outer membrane protein transport protein [Bacteroidota bacterium]